MEQVKNFILNNKVFLTGLLGAIAVTVQQFIGNQQFDFKALAIAVGIAVLGFLANQWRGQGASMAGIVSIAAGAIVVPLQSGQPISWAQVIASFIAGVLAAVAPQPKPKGQ